MPSGSKRSRDGALKDGGAFPAERFVIEIPPEARSISLARVFAGTIARAFGCPEERIDDVKIAVSEACTNAVKAHERAEVADDIMLAVARPDPTSLVFEIADSGRASEGSDAAEPEGDLGQLLIGSLFATEVTANRPQGTIVRFTVITAEPV